MALRNGGSKMRAELPCTGVARRVSKASVVWKIILSLVLILCIRLYPPTSLKSPKYSKKPTADRVFDEYGSISPSRTLQWHSCFDANFRCAKLQVAMEYNCSAQIANATASTVELALILVSKIDGYPFSKPTTTDAHR